jgi:hypothetical protein
MLSKNLTMRVDEEKQSQRAYFSVRDDLVNGTKSASWIIRFVERKIENGQNVRVFHFELDRARCVSYIEQEQIEIPSIYFFAQA